LRVVESGDCPEVRRQELIPDERYRQLRLKYPRLRCGMGAESIKELLKRFILLVLDNAVAPRFDLPPGSRAGPA
jgi:hypothetical protein